jgi:hypothetical protein
MHGSIAEVEAGPMDSDFNPALATSSDDGQQLTVAFARQPVESPGPFTEIRHATLAPWSAWPAGGPLSPVHGTFAHPQLSPALAVDRAPGNRFALLVAHEFGASFAPAVEPNASNTGGTTTPPGVEPRFVSLGPSGSHLVGTLTPDGELVASEVRVTGAGIEITSTVIGCAAQPIEADAVPYADGWLVALSNGKNAPTAGGCPGGSAGAGPPTRVDLLWVHPGTSFDFAGGLDAGAPIQSVRAAPHADGAWLVYRVVSGGKVAPIRVARRNVAQAGFVGPGDLGTEADFPLEFDAAALGDRLVIAWGNDPAGNPADLMLSVFDESIAPIATTAFEPSFYGPLSVIGSPDAKSLVVGWATTSFGRRIQLARFDCVP